MRGWWNAPTRFLPCAVLIAGLAADAANRPAPAAWSAPARRAARAASSPRRTRPGRRPRRRRARSPPCAARRRASSSWSTTLCQVSRLFDASPGGHDDLAARRSRSPPARPAAPADAGGATVSSVTTTARFCGSTRREQRAGPGQQPVADHDVVAGARQRDRQPPRRTPVEQRLQHAARWSCPGSHRRNPPTISASA